MAESVTKRRDGRLIAVTTAIIVAIGLVLAGVIWLLVRHGTDSSACGRTIAVGDVSLVRDQVKDGPSFAAPGDTCQFWTTLHDGQLVAVRTTILGRSCRIDWGAHQHAFVCNGVPVPWNELATYPSRVVAGPNNRQLWTVDLSS